MKMEKQHCFHVLNSMEINGALEPGRYLQDFPPTPTLFFVNRIEDEK